MATPPHGITFDAARIGLLLDWPVGEPAHLIEPITLAFEEAAASRRLPRAIELVVETAHGLPLHSADRAIAGYRQLVDAGCVGVIGPRTRHPRLEDCRRWRRLICACAGGSWPLDCARRRP